MAYQGLTRKGWGLAPPIKAAARGLADGYRRGIDNELPSVFRLPTDGFHATRFS